MMNAGQSMPINTFVNSNNNHHLEKQQLRESLTAEIVADVEYEINDLLAWVPDSLTAKDRKAIRDEVMAQTRLVTDALSTEELQNEGARRAYTCGAVATIWQLINFRLAQTKRD
jgi:endonuclease I